MVLEEWESLVELRGSKEGSEAEANMGGVCGQMGGVRRVRCLKRRRAGALESKSSRQSVDVEALRESLLGLMTRVNSCSEMVPEPVPARAQGISEQETTHEATRVGTLEGGDGGWLRGGHGLMVASGRRKR